MTDASELFTWDKSKLVLDACCASKMFWFDKKDKRAVFSDRRRGVRIVDVGTKGTIGRKPVVIEPDIIADFRSLPFPDETFWHVIFDPPHLYKSVGRTGKIPFSYGWLSDSWRGDLALGFSECFRVLKTNGTLIFKWNEVEIPLGDVLKLTDEKPLYGHRSGKKSLTHWVAFLKGDGA